MPVENIAVEPVTARRDTPVPELAQTMLDEDLGDLIVTEDDEPVGIVTDRDIALAVARADDLDALTAADVMTPDPVTIDADATAVELPSTMAEGGVRRIPVVDDGRLVGVATLDDVVATTGEMLDDAATVIEAQSREYEPDE
ncbi:MAG: CBS domain-containing protein [Halorientalis sp.]